MKKRTPAAIKKIILAVLAAAISAGIPAADYGSLDDYRSKISALESARLRIIEKEKIVESLRSRPGSGSLWNFIGRSNQEQSVQKRSRIIMEISGLKDEAAADAGALLMAREKLVPLMPANVLDKDFMAVLDYMDSLKVSELCSYEFIADAGNGRPADAQALDFLRYKAETQALKVQAMDVCLKYLKVKLQAVQEAKLAPAIPVVESQIAALKESRAKAAKAQELLLKLLDQGK
jgi:hypothetical protein